MRPLLVGVCYQQLTLVTVAKKIALLNLTQHLKSNFTHATWPVVLEHSFMEETLTTADCIFEEDLLIIIVVIDTKESTTTHQLM